MNKVLILDFGSQYTQLIARRVRESHVYCEIHPYTQASLVVARLRPSAIILSGGPQSVLSPDAPKIDPKLFEINCPILGICYGMQLMSLLLGGGVHKAATREYGHARVRQLGTTPLFSNLSPEIDVWMSHGDSVDQLPAGFRKIAESENGHLAGMADEAARRYAIQFHPEVVHTPDGPTILANFLFNVVGLKPDWTMKSFIETKRAEIQQCVGDEQVVCAISGGVDSTVASVFLHDVIGNQLHPIFVDNGLLRKNEAAQVMSFLKDALSIDVRMVDAAQRFLRALEGVTDPEAKRKTIGELFIRIFEEEARKIGNIRFLVQGTLYPDVIESVSLKGPSATIKSHHNVGGLPERMGLLLIEPFRELFKDEVREIGHELGVPKAIINRHPFPGPGLAIRVPGLITAERLDLLREVDAIFIEELHRHGLYDQIWQAFAVLLPVRSVGVMGDERTYEHVVALRAVTSVDGMTADWAHIPDDILAAISRRLINDVNGVNRVVYDISSKPPATIEWE